MPRLTELVTRASWRVRRGTAKELEPIGITYAQARCCASSRARRSRCAMADLADRLDVVPRSATSMIDALESAGLVERRPDTTDRRSIRLTRHRRGRGPAGIACEPLRVAKAEELFGKLTAAEQRELARMLERVLDDEPKEAGAPMMHGPPAMRSMMRDSSVTSVKLPPGTVRRMLGYARPYKKLIIVFLVLVVLDAIVRPRSTPSSCGRSSTTASAATTPR